MEPDNYMRTPEAHFFNDDTDEKVGVIVYNFDKQVLIVKSYIHNRYSFPKGSRKVGETQWEGAVREAWEEAGIDITEHNYKGICNLKHGTYFIIELKTRYCKCKPKEKETAVALWRSKADLKKKPRRNNIDLNIFCNINEMSLIST